LPSRKTEIVAQLVRASVCGTEGRGFETHRSPSGTLDTQGFSSLKKVSRPKTRPNSRPISTLFELFSKESPMKISYKKAKLYNAKNNLEVEWYVYYYYEIPGRPGQYQRFKERFNINRKSTLAERLAYGKQMVEFINSKLESGFNPWAVQENLEISSLTILKQLSVIVSELTNGETKSARDLHNSHMNRFKRFLQDKQLLEIPLTFFTETEAEGYKEWLIGQKLAAKTINESITYINRYFKIALKKKWVLSNCFAHVEPYDRRKRKEADDKAEKFEPISSSEMKLIFPMLREKGEINYINYLSIILYAWARPVEISRLRVGQVDLLNGIISFKSNETKNLTFASVQIVPQLLKLLKTIELEKYPPNYYLFSRDAMKPGIVPLGESYTSKKWKRLVKDPKTGLGINKDQYALKHTGNIDYLLSNKGKTDLKWQQMQNRHKTAVMTERYNRKLGAYFIEVGEINFSVF
jgi:integrase